MSDTNKDPYNKGGFLAFIFSVVVSLGLFVYVSFIYEGIELDQVVEVKEGEASAPAFDMATVDQPWVEAAEIADHGKKIYAMNCAVCHGPNGAGDGPGGAALNPKPRDLVKGEWTVGGNSEMLFTTISKGIAGTSMAAFGHLSVNDRWAMVQYIRAITKNKTPDDAAKLEAFAKSAK